MNKQITMKNRSAIRGDQTTLADIYREETDRIKPLDRELIGTITMAIAKGLPPDDACAVAFVGESQYDIWYGAGQALYAGDMQHPGIPTHLPQQPGEEDDDYATRKKEWIKECDLHVDFYLLCNQAQQASNEEMMNVIRDYAKGDNFDSWRAAQAVLKMTGGDSYNRGERHTLKVEHSGQIEQKADIQISSLIQDLAAVAGSGLEAKKERIIEGEIIDDPNPDTE